MVQAAVKYPGHPDLAHIHVVEELSRADPSVGWAFMVNALATALAAAFCEDDAIATMFGGAVRPIFAGMLGPGGRSIEVDGGYVGGGKYSFGSGCAHFRLARWWDARSH